MSQEELYKIPNEYTYKGLTFNEDMIPPDLIDDIQELKLTDKDVVLASYPRTGTTFLSHVLSLILADDDEVQTVTNSSLLERWPFVEMCRPGKVRRHYTNIVSSASPRCIKTHLPYFLCEKWAVNSPAKVVVVMRNPKDNLVSLYNFYKSMDGFGRMDRPWSEFFKLYQAKKVVYGDNLDWFRGFWQHRETANICIVFYEDLVKDLPKEVSKLAGFLDKDVSELRMQMIVKEASFENMASKPSTFYLSSHSSGFINKGKVGQWKDYFTVAQNEYIDQRIEKELQDTGLEFTYTL